MSVRGSDGLPQRRHRVAPREHDGSGRGQHAAQRGVLAQDDLSTTAKNVKVITEDGVVTLRGPVNSAQEKSEVAQLARQVSGVKTVDNQLEIAAK
jgi:hypothetical protein